MVPKEFRIRLVGRGGAEAFTVPFSVEEVFGRKARLPVRGTINGFPYRSSVFPMGDGKHYMVVNKGMREGAGVQAGDTVKVTMEVDTAPRIVTVSAYFKKALAKHKNAKAAFEKLSYTHKKEWVEWIEEAKKAETRSRRIEKAVATLLACMTRKG